MKHVISMSLCVGSLLVACSNSKFNEAAAPKQAEVERASADASKDHGACSGDECAPAIVAVSSKSQTDQSISQTPKEPEVVVAKKDPAPVTPQEPNTNPAPAPSASPAPAANPNIVTFGIAPGTGANPWNTAGTMITGKVGQQLVITNNDTVAHRLHTGGKPCPHQQGNIAPGGSFTCDLAAAIDPGAANPTTYDHIAGNSAFFFLKVTP